MYVFAIYYAESQQCRHTTCRHTYHMYVCVREPVAPRCVVDHTLGGGAVEATHK